MKNKRFLLAILTTVITSLLIAFGLTEAIGLLKTSNTTASVATQNIQSQISAAGTIHSQDEATLHFQTGGKLVYLPVKEGDSVYAGQTIGQLDTYALQRQLTVALNDYRTTRDTFDQTQANNQTGVLQNGQKSALNIYSQSSLGGDTQTNAINDAAKRVLDQNQSNLDNSVINVELANYALQLSTLSSPINGIVTQEDVTVANQNVTPATSFTVADPSLLVFRANVLATDIDFVSEGAQAKIMLDGVKTPFTGTVIKVYPQKTTLPTGVDVYTVDIQSDALKSYAKFGQNGSALITSNTDDTVVMVPTWTILGHNFLWVEENGKIMLKKVTLGKTHDNLTEVVGGLISRDKVVTNPAVIAKQRYSLL